VRARARLLQQQRSLDHNLKRRVRGSSRRACVSNMSTPTQSARMPRANRNWVRCHANSVRRCSGIALVAAIAASAASAQLSSPATETEVAVRIAQSSGSDCAARLVKFVEALDKVLDTNPSSAGPLSALLHHFPMESCNIDEAIKISRQSKYFFSVSNHTGYYTIRFSNAGFSDGLGFSVTFALLKKSGDTHLPSVFPNRERIRR